MKPISNIKSHKSELHKNVYLVIILSIGISLIANAISQCFQQKWWNLVLLIFGVACVVFVFVTYLIDFYRHKSYKIKTDAIFVTDNKGNLISVPLYIFDDELKEVLESVFNENRAYHKLWMKSFDKSDTRKDGVKYSQKYVKISRVDDSNIDKYIKDSGGFCLIRDAVEYMFIDWLSTSQNRYFQELKETSDVDVLMRQDIPSFLLDNKIIDAISKPFDEREKFISKTDDSNAGEDIHFLEGEDGVIFQKFELQLPKKSTLRRDGDKLIIRNRNYEISLYVDFKGFNAQLPSAFENLIIGETNIIPYNIKIELEVELNPFFFLFFSDWKYLKWIDIMCDRFLDYFSFDRYIYNIGYKHALTNVIMNRNLFKKRMANAKDR